MKHVEQNRIQSFAFVISILLAVFLSLSSISSSGREASDPDRRQIKLDSRINPNNAPIESLARLPGLGTVRAGAIVAYRQKHNVNNFSKPVFQSSEDLQKVNGIGPKTVQNIKELLKFE